jgi:hypothetical protein
MDQYTLYLFIPCFMFVVDTTVENWTSGRKMASPKAGDFCYTTVNMKAKNMKAKTMLVTCSHQVSQFLSHDCFPVL